MTNDRRAGSLRSAPALHPHGFVGVRTDGLLFAYREAAARAIEGEGITDLSQRVGNSWGPGRTAVLNGIFVDARFEDGELLKIARSVPYTPRPDPTRSLETSETDAPR